MGKLREQALCEVFEVVSLIINKARSRNPGAKLCVFHAKPSVDNGDTSVDIYTLNGDEVLRVTMADKGFYLKTTFIMERPL